jgi:hypothetical protein
MAFHERLRFEEDAPGLMWCVARVGLPGHRGRQTSVCLYAHRFVLIETAIGKIVLDYQALQERLGEQISQVAPGGYLEWEPARLDILAILAKRDPRPGE